MLVLSPDFSRFARAFPFASGRNDVGTPQLQIGVPAYGVTRGGNREGVAVVVVVGFGGAMGGFERRGAKSGR